MVRARMLIALRMLCLCVALALQLPAAASALAAGGNANDETMGGSDLCPAAAVVRRAAVDICSGDTVAAALRRVGLARHTADAIGDQMAALELRTTLDLRLLANTPEAEHLFASLAHSGISIGARAKVRLLLTSDLPDHVADEPQTGANGMQAMGAEWQQRVQGQMGVPRSGALRRLQQESQGTGLSLDSLAIMVSVLLGVAGCEFALAPCLCGSYAPDLKSDHPVMTLGHGDALHIS
eukprot:SAG31_NODE_1234_length_9204_cov_9.297748_5_plen_238_part_00